MGITLLPKRAAVSIPLGERVHLAIKTRKRLGPRQHRGPGPTILEQRRIDAGLKLLRR
jgi:hypothetical protein